VLVRGAGHLGEGLQDLDLELDSVELEQPGELFHGRERRQPVPRLHRQLSGGLEQGELAGQVVTRLDPFLEQTLGQPLLVHRPLRALEVGLEHLAHPLQGLGLILLGGHGGPLGLELRRRSLVAHLLRRLAGFPLGGLVARRLSLRRFLPPVRLGKRLRVLLCLLAGLCVFLVLLGRFADRIGRRGLGLVRRPRQHRVRPVGLGRAPLGRGIPFQLDHDRRERDRGDQRGPDQHQPPRGLPLAPQRPPAQRRRVGVRCAEDLGQVRGPWLRRRRGDRRR